MGRKTYEIISPDYLPIKEGGTLAVLTHRTNDTASQSNVVFTDKKPKEVVAMLKERGHEQAVIIGGARTAGEFAAEGLVDELIMVIEPFLFSAGLPLFKDVDFERQLRLQEVKKLNENTILARYFIDPQ